MDKAQIGIAIGLGISAFLLYSRKSKWFNPKIVGIICVLLLIIGLVGLLTQNPCEQNQAILFANCLVPAFYFGLDRIFKNLSFKNHNRDFILWLRWSNEIDDSLGAENPHVKIHDKLMSMGLLIFIVCLVLVAGLFVPDLVENSC